MAGPGGFDPSRLFTALNNTGLQTKDNPLYQVIYQLIGALRDLKVSTSGSSSSSSSVINQITNILGGPAFDGLDGNDGIGFPGPNGRDGIPGIIGPSGRDGIDGLDGIGVPGIQGATGATGANGRDGIPGMDGIDSSDDLIITPPFRVISASELIAGTLLDARLSANVPLLNALNTFTVLQTITTAAAIGLITSKAIRAAGAGTADGSFVDGFDFGGFKGIGYDSPGGFQFVLGGYRTSQWNALGLYTSGTEALHINTSQAIQFPAYGAGAATFDASGNITSVSDERYKNIKGTFALGLSEILNIKPIVFQYNDVSELDTDNIYAGFSAQNVKQYIPEAVGKNLKGLYSINTIPILASVINAIKELTVEIDELRSLLNLPIKTRTIIPIGDDLRVIDSAKVKPKPKDPIIRKIIMDEDMK